MSTLTWRQYGDLSNPYTWSPSQSPKPGDALIQNQGATYAFDENLSENTLYLGSNDQTNPAVLYTVDATVRVNAGVQPGDGPFGTHYSAIVDLGSQDRILLDEESHRGRSSASIYAATGNQTQVIGDVHHASLSISGPGILTGESINATDQASVKITSAMLGTGSLVLDNSSAEIDGRVGAYQGITFMHADNTLTVDHADQFFGTLDMSTAPNGAVVDLNGIQADWTGFWGDKLYLWGSGKLEQIAVQPSSAGFDVYKTAAGAAISPYPPPQGGSLLLRVPGAAMS